MTLLGRPAVGVVAADTLRLENILAKLAVGEQVSYAVLGAAIGRPVQTAAKGCLATARRRLLRERQMVFDCVPGQGVLRLGDAQMVGKGGNVVRHIKRAAKKGMAIVLSVADFDKLPADLKIKHNATAVLLGSVAVLSGPGGRRRIAAKIEQTRVLTAQDVRAIAESL